jgi:DNA modification methylase
MRVKSIFSSLVRSDTMNELIIDGTTTPPTDIDLGGMVVRQMRISDLRPAPWNPREISPEALAGLQMSIAKWGLVEPLVLNQRSGFLVGGHQRLEAMKRLGMEEAPVVLVDLDETEEKALNVALNSQAISGAFTTGLEALLAEIKTEFPHDVYAGLRFDEIEIPDADAMEYGANGGDPDAVPETPTEPITKPGDLWILGNHRLLCGDATKRQDATILLGSILPELMFTDPPYGVMHGRGVTKAKSIGGDLSQAVIPIGFAVAIEHLADDARIFVCVGSENIAMYLGLWDHHLGRSPRVIVWVKDSFILRHHGYHSQYELIFHGWKGNGGAVWYGDRKQSDVWKVTRSKETEHSTEKPVELATRAINDTCSSGGDILDPFLGSGSTLIAAEMLGRNCYAMEIEPRYCDVAVRRWEQFTGKTAERVESA